MIERAIEKFLFASRWLLAPFFIALAFGLFVLLVKMGQAFVEFALHAWSGSESDAILSVLGLVDLTLTGSLLVIVIFSGYENFVSRINAAEHADWPEWMAKIDFTGLKLKLLSSIVAISAIQLLRAFMDVKNTSDRELAWYVGIHLAFVASGLVLALTDRLSERAPSQGA
ncbi:MAG: TIGR00645 family protein [Beijerinckiaceae bacterium]